MLITFDLVVEKLSAIAMAPVTPPVSSVSSIDHGGQVTVYIGAALLVIGSAVVVGAFSRRVEHALMAALVVSLLVIMFFVFLA